MTYYETLIKMREDEMTNIFLRLHLGVIYHTIFSVCTALIVWEYILNIDAEIRTWKNLFNGQILPARLAVLVACEGLFYAHYAAYCIVWASSTSIFLMRVQILFMNQRLLCIAYYIIWASCLGAWIFTVTQIRSIPTAKTFTLPYVPSCVPLRFPRLGVIAWSASVLFDVSVFLGTYMRYRSTFRHTACKTARITSQAHSRKWSFQANFYYFGMSLILNIACLFSALLVDDSILSHVGAVVAMTHMSIIATRLVFSAKGWAKKFGREDDLVNDSAVRFHRGGDGGGGGMRGEKGEAKKSAIRFTVNETVMYDTNGDHDDDDRDEECVGGRDDDQISQYEQGKRSSESHHKPYQQSDSVNDSLELAYRSEKTTKETSSPSSNTIHRD